MLLTILSGVVLIVGIILIVIGRDDWDVNVKTILGILLTLIGGVVLVILSVLAIIAAATKDKVYQDMLYQRKVLEYRLSHEEENTIGNELLYSDIVEFNNELRSDKTYSDNIWINWFFNDKVATIDYIEIQEISEEE